MLCSRCWRRDVAVSRSAQAHKQDMTNELESARARALELLSEGQRFLLTGHVRPDGDCIGAQAALASLLRALGKQVQILNPDPVQPQFDYLTERLDYAAHTGGSLPEHDVTVLLDGSELSRCGALEAPLSEHASKKLVIDHHVHLGQAWWDAAYVDQTASATGLLVHRMARQLGVELDELGALGVFTSLVTDTGWFKYSNTDAETLAVASEMLARGVEAHRVFGSIYQRQPAQQPYGIGRALRRMEYLLEQRIAVVDLPFVAESGSDLASSADLSDSDELLDILRAVESVEVVLFLRELADGTCKLSARAKHDYPVNELAARFGGGGHRKAAGATLQGPLVEARRRVVESLVGDFEQALAGDGS